MRARGQLGWLHADGDLRPVGAMAFAGGGNFAPAGLPVARDVLQVELGADITLNRSASLGLYYAGQFAGQVSDAFTACGSGLALLNACGRKGMTVSTLACFSLAA